MSTTVPAADAAVGLRDSFRGALLTSSDAGYDEARALYNAMIDRRPALIARCADVADVAAGVEYARGSGLRLAVRGGGHNGPGLGSVDDGVCLDLSPMHAVRVDPDARTVRVEGGATIAGVDHASARFGLAVPLGTVSTTGVGGLTLGGGIGHLTRRWGLSIDNLLEADVVLADGRLVTASEDREPDLFWALRGGGGNFGVVTSFLFRAWPVSTVIGGPMLWRVEEAPQAMALYRDVIEAAPDELTGFFAFLAVPPVAPFPPELHLQVVCGVVWCWTGAPEDADAALAGMRALPPLLDGVAPMPFTALNSAFDALLPKGMQWYWRADFFRELPDEAIARHADVGARPPTPLSQMHLYPIDGAAARVGADDTAWAARDARFAEVIVGVDPDPANAAALRDWTAEYWQALHPYSMGGAYLNVIMDEGQERVRATYGDHYDRLAAIKARYDPENLFSVNQNIRPATA